jgi:hypothetical protein
LDHGHAFRARAVDPALPDRLALADTKPIEQDLRQEASGTKLKVS